MYRVRNIILPCVALATTAVLGCSAEMGDAPQEGGSGLSVRLAALEAGSGRIEYSLTNHSAEPLRVLSWKTGLDPLPDPLFAISRDGTELEYRGPILHRLPPEPADYVEIAPGQRLAGAIDLTQFYDLRSRGTYEVRLRPQHAGLVLGGESVALDSGAPVRIEVAAENAAAGMASVAVRSQALRAGCSAEQYEELATAEDVALANTQEASEYFDANGYDDRALRWFGTGNTQDANYVGAGLHDILGRLESGGLEYVCNAGGWCSNPRTAAWVDAYGAPGRINLCGPFWEPDAPPMWTKAVAITHEIAHFYTRSFDFGYGEAALALAKQAPALARSNAENYALYTIDSQIP